MASVAEFLIWLSQRPGELEDFKSNPDAVMDRWESESGETLTDEQRAVLRTGDLQEIRSYVEATVQFEGEAAATKVVWGIVWG